jgi:DNA-binding PadR family transcriptional regulator
MIAGHIEPIHQLQSRRILAPVLELAILGLLKERPMHGYDLRKRMREEFRLLANLSFGSVYPALGRLESMGAVHAISTSAVGVAAARAIPLTGSLSGERAAYRASQSSERRAVRGTRARKVYEITTHGNELFEQMLEDSSDRSEDIRAFSLRLVFARHLSPEARLRLFERRRAHLLDDLDHSRRAIAGNTRPLDPYERSLVEHTSAAAENDISWLDRLIEAERSAKPVAVHADPRRDR